MATEIGTLVSFPRHVQRGDHLSLLHFLSPTYLPFMLNSFSFHDGGGVLFIIFFFSSYTRSSSYTAVERERRGSPSWRSLSFSL